MNTNSIGSSEELKINLRQDVSILENPAVGLYRSKLDGSAFTEVNQTLCDKLGYSREEIFSYPPTIHWANTRAREELIAQLMNEGSVLNYEANFITRSGEIKHGLLSLNLSPQEGYVEGVVLDITEYKRAEKERAYQMIQSYQLQKAEGLSRMARAVVHRFNNQLAIVMGNLELAFDQILNEEAAERITAAMQAASQAVEISRSLSTYLGQTTGKCEPMNLSKVCSRCLSMLQRAIPKKLKLKIDIQSHGPTIIANENLIQQLMTNLITNAWEASEQGGSTITLSVKMVSAAEIPAVYRNPIGWQPQDLTYACLEVRDDGLGIEDKDIEKIFDPFYTSKFLGRGLGLSIVLGIARVYQGVIAVESKPGQGSTFQVFLPVSDHDLS